MGQALALQGLRYILKRTTAYEFEDYILKNIVRLEDEKEINNKWFLQDSNSSYTTNESIDKIIPEVSKSKAAAYIISHKIKHKSVSNNSVFEIEEDLYGEDFNK